MIVEGLTMPTLLVELLAAGRWPRDLSERPRLFISENCRRSLQRIELIPPPFHTYAAFAARGWDSFYNEFGATHELVPELTIEIADFGLGSDSPIVLDFQLDRAQPRVLYLHWQDRGDDNTWAPLTRNFADFVELLGL